MENNEVDKDIEETATNLINSLTDPKNTEKVNQIIEQDPMSGLQNNIIEFFNDRMTTVRKQESLKTKVQAKLEDMVESGALAFDDLKSLFITLSKESTIASDGIIGLFKPTPGAQSPFAQNLSRSTDEREAGLESFYDDLSSEDKRKIDVLTRFIASVELPEDKS